MERSFEEKVRRAKATPFSLPAEISMQKTLLSTNTIAYVFRHTQWGELGRLLILPHPSGAQFSVEVAGDPGDPMTPTRQAVLEPVAQDLLQKMTAICGQSTGGESQPYDAPQEKYVIESLFVPCDHCDQSVAMLIVAPDATTQDTLEDCARRMYASIQEMSIPTWMLGEERQIKIKGQWTMDVLTMKVYPTRRSMERILVPAFDRKLDRLIATHCQRR